MGHLVARSLAVDTDVERKRVHISFNPISQIVLIKLCCIVYVAVPEWVHGDVNANSLLSGLFTPELQTI